jgi:hypothetical protein
LKIFTGLLTTGKKDHLNPDFMKTMNLSRMYGVMLLLLATLIAGGVQAQRKVVGYINTTNNPDQVDYTRITHLNIAFENPDDAGNLSWSGNNATFVQRAHANNVKVLVSICGGGESNNATTRARYFNLISPANRAAFISKIVAYMNSHQLDGIDLDLEGPAINGDYNGFVADLNNALPAGKLLTAALAHDNGGDGVSSATVQTFDFLNIMAYDYGWGQAVHHSTYSYATTSINWWMTNRGLPASKVVLGVPFYGYTNTTGAGGLSFAQILNNYGAAAANQDTWSSGGNTIYYNGLPTIRQKTQLVVDQNYGGVMIWNLAQDASGANSLLQAIDQVIKSACTLPAQPGSITGNSTVISGSSQTYSIAAVANATSYTWTLPSGWSGTSTSTSISTTAGSTGGNITVRANNACGAGPIRSLAITVTTCTLPAQPGTITGSTTIAAGSAQTYSIGAVSGATSYTWSLPSGWAGSSTATSINATAGSAGGNITVRANNSCGAGPARTLAITVSATPNLALNRPATASSVETGTTFTAGNTVDGNLTTRWSSGYNNSEWIYVDLGSTYAVNRVKVTWEAAYATAYEVQISANASSWTTIRAVSGITTLVNDHTGLSGTGRYVRINGLTRATPWGYSIFEIEVYGTASCTLPAQPGTISGNTTTTAGSNQAYSVTAVSGATSYTWTLPSGWSGSSTSTSITTTVGSAGGSITVRANNSCGAGPTRSLAVSVTTPSANLALNRPATVSSIEPTTTFSGALAVDGNLSTRWSSGYSNAEWIYVDLGNTYAVNRAKVTWEAAYATAYEVQISSNATSWTTIKSVTGNTTLVNDHTGLSGTGRYVRINGITRSTQWGYSIFEIEVYGTLNGGKISTAEISVDSDSFDLFPNPVSTTLNIDAREFSEGSMTLIDATGRTLISSKIVQSPIDVSSLPVGFYFVKLNDGSRLAVKKFKKQ